MTEEIQPRVAIVMGSDSDWDVMKAAEEVLNELGVTCDVRVISAHRSHQLLVSHLERLHASGVQVFIAGAGGAAHLAGVVAALTPLPVIGVPLKSWALDGMDALLSTVQMPPGVPVATVAINGARNAGILAAQMLSLTDPQLKSRMQEFRKGLVESVQKKNDHVQKRRGDSE